MSKKKEPILLISIPLHLYPFDVLVSINHTDKQLDGILIKEGIKELSSRKLSEYGNGVAKYVIWHNEQKCLIRIPCIPRTSNNYSALMHEILHVVISVLRAIGMRIEEEGGSDEAYTYLMSYLVQEVFQSINKYY